ncbi:MAG: AbrB/MazE/SpoVT family DNA-binding domain-containing protein [Candidatus Berkelbacteria bacterium]|nr:AbrB/MazE/SpoVT family DNA-binding domain-containing protein [Candidatus Berkelbacteria bacterium]MCR4307855.1 AbrB/MazE/SpoVT family DNA-binding domain-containing protein [Candidatus Berkelbacteria bacterium]
MTYRGKLNHKGQITIPVALRQRYNLYPGQTVILDDSTDIVSIKPVRDLASLRGSLKSNLPYDEKAIKKAVEKYRIENYLAKEARSK